MVWGEWPMSILEGLFLGLVQGLTEFLPISSSGHLVLFQKLFGIKGGALSFDVAVHFASLLAVLWVFRKDVLYMIMHPFSKLTKLVIVELFLQLYWGLHLRISSINFSNRVSH
jgi:undecaprenyl-diphosphatase